MAGDPEAPVRATKARGFMPSWPLLLALVAVLRTLAEPRSVLGDPDTYLHIAAGRWALVHRTLPIHDPFSHTMAGKIWIPHEWLAEVIMAAIYYGLAGWQGLVLMTAALFAVAMAILTRRLLRYGEPLSTAILAFATAVTLLPHLLARPHILALPVMVVWTAELFEARDAGRRPSPIILPLMTLWANLHGGYMFGVALTLYLAVEAVVFPGAQGRRREASGWARFFGLTLVASLITPLGLGGLLQPLRMVAMPAMLASVSEWQSPNFQGLQPLELWLLGAIFIGFSTGVRLPISRLLLLLGLFHLSLQHVRHADLLCIVGPLAIGASLGPRIAKLVRSDPPSVVAVLARRLAAPARPPALLLALGLCGVAGLAFGLQPLPRADSDSRPAAAVAAAGRMGLSGPVFNTESFGGYLIFNGIPTYIDGRFELYGDDFLKSYLKAVGGREPALTEALDGHGVTWTLLSPGEGAVAQRDHRPGWRRVYTDPVAVIHVRQDGTKP